VKPASGDRETQDEGAFYTAIYGANPG
jgi:hypothetical protein